MRVRSVPLIVPFRPDLAPAFTRLNRAWIERLFALEDADWKVLRDPAAAIIDPGRADLFRAGRRHADRHRSRRARFGRALRTGENGGRARISGPRDRPTPRGSRHSVDCRLRRPDAIPAHEQQPRRRDSPLRTAGVHTPALAARHGVLAGRRVYGARSEAGHVWCEIHVNHRPQTRVDWSRVAVLHGEDAQQFSDRQRAAIRPGVS